MGESVMNTERTLGGGSSPPASPFRVAIGRGAPPRRQRSARAELVRTKAWMAAQTPPDQRPTIHRGDCNHDETADATFPVCNGSSGPDHVVRWRASSTHRALWWRARVGSAESSPLALKVAQRVAELSANYGRIS